jgi:hypothetical protein
MTRKKKSKEDVAFRSVLTHTDRNKTCGTCANFRHGFSCTRVKGEVSITDVCILWEAKK